MRWRGQSASLGGIFCAAKSRLKHPTFFIVRIHLVRERKTPTPKRLVAETKNPNWGGFVSVTLSTKSAVRVGSKSSHFSDKKKKD